MSRDYSVFEDPNGPTNLDLLGDDEEYCENCGTVVTIVEQNNFTDFDGSRSYFIQYSCGHADVF